MTAPHAEDFQDMEADFTNEPAPDSLWYPLVSKLKKTQKLRKAIQSKNQPKDTNEDIIIETETTDVDTHQSDTPSQDVQSLSLPVTENPPPQTTESLSPLTTPSKMSPIPLNITPLKARLANKSTPKKQKKKDIVSPSQITGTIKIWPTFQDS